jgi:hypothetical protein
LGEALSVLGMTVLRGSGILLGGGALGGLLAWAILKGRDRKRARAMLFTGVILSALTLFVIVVVLVLSINPDSLP